MIGAIVVCRLQDNIKNEIFRIGKLQLCSTDSIAHSLWRVSLCTKVAATANMGMV